jgi:hypothetical protein
LLVILAVWVLTVQVRAISMLHLDCFFLTKILSRNRLYILNSS